MKKYLLVAAMLSIALQAQAFPVVTARAPVVVARPAPVVVRTAPAVAPARPVVSAPATKPSYNPTPVRPVPYVAPVVVHTTVTEKQCPEGTKLDVKTKECKKPQ